MKYNLELDKAAEEIKKEKAKNVLIQLPDGLKPKATEIVSFLREKTDANIFIWMGSCWGSCDYPEIRNIDLLIQFGHAAPSILRPIPG
ncbi:MAG: diphthamide synthesis protein [Nanoarchaeota archaeon]